MMNKQMMSQRTTTILSALVALAILGLGVTAQSTGDPASGRREALESDLRFQIEMSWRHDGRTREAREAQLAATLAAWEASPQTGHDRQLLEQWLRGAIVGTLPGESGEFPPTPAFSQRAVEAKKPAAAAGVAAESSPLPPLVESPPETKPTPPAGSNSAQSSTPRDVRLKPGQAYTPPKAKEFRITPRTPGSSQATTEPPAPAPPAPHPKRVIAAKPIEAPPSVATPATKQMIASDEPRVPNKPPSTDAEDRPQRETPPAITATSPAPPAMVQPATEAPTVVKSSSPPTPPVDDQSTPPLRSAPERQSSAAPEDAAAPVTVNLVELNAQIRGYHEGLDEIDSIVVAKEGRLATEDIANLVGQLEQLAAQYQFVRLYYDGLSKSERRFVAAPRSMGETIELIDEQRAALAAEEEDFLTALEGDVAEDGLAKRLKAVAKEVGVDEPANSKNRTGR